MTRNGVGDNLNQKIQELEGIFRENSGGVTASIRIAHAELEEEAGLSWKRDSNGEFRIMFDARDSSQPLLEQSRLTRVIAVDYLPNLWEAIDVRRQQVEASVENATHKVESLIQRIRGSTEG